MFSFGFVVAAMWVAAALTAAAAPAIQDRPGPPPPGNRDPFSEIRERQQREAQLRSVEMFGKAAPVDRRADEAAAAQVRQDFKRIQVLRNEIARHILSGKPLDHKFIVEETAEVNRRAGRLKTFLAREPAEGNGKEQKRVGDMPESLLKDALVTLCKRIDSFTENPMFKMPEVIDVKEFEMAEKDLDTIVLLSDAVRKGAEKAGKTAKK
ncbi:MAG TPA: hypothetical protein VF240_17870 [Pyrinomonadaceae bacterium]